MFVRKVWNGKTHQAGVYLIAGIILLNRPSQAEPDPLIRVSQTARDSTNARVAVLPDSSEIYVVWEDQRPDAPGLYFRRFSSAGLPRTEPICFSPRGSRPVIAVGSDGLARVAWLDVTNVYLTILDPQGAQIPDRSFPRLVRQRGWEPSIAIGPDNEVTIVCEGQLLANFNIYFSRFDATGTLLICDGKLDEPTILGGSRKKLAVAIDGAGCIEVISLEPYGWMELSYRAALRTIHRDDCPPGTDEAEHIADIQPNYDCPAIALWPPDPQRTFLFWQERVGGHDRIVSDTALPFDRSTGDARRPQAACDSTQIATVVWHDNRDGNQEIYYAQVRADGTRVRQEDTRLTDHPALSRNPDVASADRRSVIVWEDNRDGAFDIYLTFTLPDCNGNGVADDVDIADRTSPDCNGNGIPDECDIGTCRSLDADGDNVPDECASGLKVDVVDPNPELLDGACGAGEPVERCLTADLGRLAEGGRIVQGLAADGVTPVVIRVDAPAAGTVEITIQDDSGSREPARVGQLQDLDGNAANPMAIPAQNVGGRWVAFALLIAPIDFAREPTDGGAPERPLSIVTTYAGGAPAVRSIRLVRPPVLLLHGIWSSAGGCWDLGLQDDPRFTVHAEDYRPTNAAHLDRNILQVRVGAERALRKLRRGCVAATQVDVIAHSMGGVLSRLHVAERRMTYRRAENLMRGDIHKLITVDTPHFGSPLADLLVRPDGTSTFIGIVFSAIGLRTDCGAVFDLRPGSNILLNLPAASVPAHAIFGTGGSDLIQQELLPELCEALILTSWPLCSILEVLGFFEQADLFPPELQHDFIVLRPSQEGGLDGPRTSRIRYDPPASYGFHMGIGKEAETNRIAIDLLNAPAADAALSQAGFPARQAAPGASPRLARQPTEPLRKGQGLLSILSPARDSALPAGTPLTVAAEGGGGFQPKSMLFLSPFGVAIVDSPPFEAVIEIPATALGPTIIAAVGRDAEGAFLMSEEIPISIKTDAHVTALQVRPGEIELFAYAPEQPLTVSGLFGDGVERDVTLPAAGTRYRVLDPSIAAVGQDGIVHGKSVGETFLFVENAIAVARVPVTVRTARGDHNSDGRVDAGDLEALVSCFSGPKENFDFVLPPVPCRDFFDFDGDTDIDRADLEAFLAIWSGPADVAFTRADANVDSTVDISDPITILRYLFAGRLARCQDAADANGDGELTIADPIFILAYLFRSGAPPPPAPFPDCGLDPTADLLNCVYSPACP